MEAPTQAAFFSTQNTAEAGPSDDHARLEVAQEGARRRSVRPEIAAAHSLKPELENIIERMMRGIGAFSGFKVDPERARIQRQRHEAEKVTRYLLDHAHVPPKFIDFDLAAVPGDLPPAFTDLAAKLIKLSQTPGRGTIVIGGPVDRGKTMLGAGLCRFFKTGGRSSRYMTAFGLCNAIAEAAFEKKQRVRESFEKPDLIVIDEVADPYTETPGGSRELIELLDRRWGHGRVTLLLTNLTPAALWGRLGAKVQRRVEDSGKFHAATWQHLNPIYTARH